MTGLTNRSHFGDSLANLLRAPDTSLAVLWIDLDNFKEVNDRFGHHAGDMVLLEVATRLKSLVRRNDVVGRIGGDEFAVLLTALDDARGPDPTALRVIEALRQPVLIGSDLVFISASVGIAVSPDDGDTCELLLQNADVAMYEAKRLGRDRYAYFNSEMNERVHDRAESVQRLRVAIREGEFVMHYQPIFNTDTGALRGAEALLRWTLDGRVAEASEFVPLAEESSQIRALGAHVFRLVPDDLQMLSSTTGGTTLQVGINLSADQLDERALFDLLTAWDIPGGFPRLVVEVTESAVLDRRRQANETLALLRRLGASLSIDDFGTGYSSLSLLERLRPDSIKLDSSLLHRARDDIRGVALLRASVELARSLCAEVVVEGVETEADRRLTVELGAEMAQGYFLARPMPIEELVEFARTHPFGVA
jgi:two-component system CheB/CheR fusion protein